MPKPSKNPLLSVFVLKTYETEQYAYWKPLGIHIKFSCVRLEVYTSVYMDDNISVQLLERSCRHR